MLRILAVVTLAATFLAASCSDSSGGTSDDRKLSEIGAGEVESLCKSFLSSISDAEWKDIARLACAISEIFQPQCSDARIDSCTTATASQIKADPTQCKQASDSQTDITACDVTVGELHTCLDDIMAAYAAIGHSASCATLSGGGTPIEPVVPASCQTLKDRCPGVLE